MVELTIDGQQVQASEGQTLLTVASEAGFDIPTLCHHEELKPSGHCRLCMVEIGSGPHTRLVNSCTYPVEAGLVVQTASDKVLQVRRMIVELLLARCPNAKPLQKLAASLGIEKSRFVTDNPEQLCILCGQCVRTCHEVVGVDAISMAGRTPTKHVSTPFEEASAACIGCGSCAFVCPTGAIPLQDKDGVRTIWHREFKLQACTVCGNYIAPVYQLQYFAQKWNLAYDYLATCKDCR